MGQRSLRPCAHGGCPALVARGTCKAHTKLRYQQDAQQRGTAGERLYTALWHKESRLFLRAHPVCLCGGAAKGCEIFATVVDHEPPHRGDPIAFWDTDTWRPMSRTCHNRKTVMHDGGFGRAPSARSTATTTKET
jgi:5-methylcytosine-specific restriction protein A